MKTIRRNAKRQIDAIFNGALTCKVYTLENSFTGVDCPPGVARQNYEQFDGKLWADGDGTFIVHIHSNLYYRLRAAV